MRDLNPRPFPCKGTALPTELIARTYSYVATILPVFWKNTIVSGDTECGILLSMIELRATVTGKVQGVRYRDYVQVSATELGVVGYVYNNPDGSVTVVGQALPDVLKQFVEYLHEGSLMAKVDGVAVEWGTVKEAYDDFSIRRL